MVPLISASRARGGFVARSRAAFALALAALLPSCVHSLAEQVGCFSAATCNFTCNTLSDPARPYGYYCAVDAARAGACAGAPGGYYFTCQANSQYINYQFAGSNNGKMCVVGPTTCLQLNWCTSGQLCEQAPTYCNTASYDGIAGYQCTDVCFDETSEPNCGGVLCPLGTVCTRSATCSNYEFTCATPELICSGADSTCGGGCIIGYTCAWDGVNTTCKNGPGYACQLRTSTITVNTDYPYSNMAYVQSCYFESDCANECGRFGIPGVTCERDPGLQRCSLMHPYRCVFPPLTFSPPPPSPLPIGLNPAYNQPPAPATTASPPPPSPPPLPPPRPPPPPPPRPPPQPPKPPPSPSPPPSPLPPSPPPPSPPACLVRASDGSCAQQRGVCFAGPGCGISGCGQGTSCIWAPVDLIAPNPKAACDAPGGYYCRVDAPQLRTGAGARHLAFAVAMPLVATALLVASWASILRDARFDDLDAARRGPKELRPLVHEVGGWEASEHDGDATRAEPEGSTAAKEA